MNPITLRTTPPNRTAERLTSRAVAAAENLVGEALYAPLLRPAPIDVALLVKVRSGLEAVPADLFEVPATLNDRRPETGSQVLVRRHG